MVGIGGAPGARSHFAPFKIQFWALLFRADFLVTHHMPFEFWISIVSVRKERQARKIAIHPSVASIR